MSTIRAAHKKPGTAETARARHRRIQLPCVTDATQPTLEVALLTLAQARAILADPMRDLRYLDTRLGPMVAAYIDWKKLGRPPRPRSTVRADLAQLAVSIPPGIGIAELDSPSSAST